MTQMLDVADGLFEELTDMLVVELVDDLPALAAPDNQPQMTQDT